MSATHVDVSGPHDIFHSETSNNPGSSLMFYHMPDDSLTGIGDRGKKWQYDVFFAYMVICCVLAVFWNCFAVVVMFRSRHILSEKSSSLLLTNCYVINFLLAVLVYSWEAWYMHENKWPFGLEFYVFFINVMYILNLAMAFAPVPLFVHLLLRIKLRYNTGKRWMAITGLLLFLPWLYGLIVSAPWLLTRFFVTHFRDGSLDVGSLQHADGWHNYAYRGFFFEWLCPVIISSVLLTVSLYLHMRGNTTGHFSPINDSDPSVYSWSVARPNRICENPPDSGSQCGGTQPDYRYNVDSTCLTSEGNRHITFLQKLKRFDWIPALFLLLNAVMKLPYFALLLVFDVHVSAGSVDWDWVSLYYKNLLYEGALALYASPVFVQPLIVILFWYVKFKKPQVQ